MLCGTFSSIIAAAVKSSADDIDNKTTGWAENKRRGKAFFKVLVVGIVVVLRIKKQDWDAEGEEKARKSQSHYKLLLLYIILPTTKTVHIRQK